MSKETVKQYIRNQYTGKEQCQFLPQMNQQDSYKRIPQDMKNLMLNLNLADDYFKAKKQISILEEELQGKEKELYDLKHELISAQIKLENAEKQGKELQKQLSEDAKKIVRLETELKDK